MTRGGSLITRMSTTGEKPEIVLLAFGQRVSFHLTMAKNLSSLLSAWMMMPARRCTLVDGGCWVLVGCHRDGSVNVTWRFVETLCTLDATEHEITRSDDARGDGIRAMTACGHFSKKATEIR